MGTANRYDGDQYGNETRRDLRSHLVRRGLVARLAPRSSSKNGKDRFVPINQTVRTMLERLPRTSEYVFPSPRTKGRLVDVKFRFDKAKKEAGIRDFRFHDLRHTAATRMADGGADAFALAEIFGWSDVRMALRYTHATDEAKRRAVENLVKPIGPSDESVTNEKGRVAALP